MPPFPVAEWENLRRLANDEAKGGFPDRGFSALLERLLAEVGDLIAVFQSGAYGYTASPLGFLSHPAPEQVLV